MKPLYLLGLLMCVCLQLAAQSTRQVEKNARRDSALRPYTEGQLSAKLNFFGLLDPETPTIQTGVEWKLSKRVSGEFTVGIPARIHGNVRNTDTTYNRYFKLKAEVRYFPAERRSFYLAPEISYISKKRSEYNGAFIGKDQDTYGYDYAEIDKSVIAIALKVGAVVPFKKNNRLFMDVFFGLGPRFVRMKLDATNVRPDAGRWMLWATDRQGSTTGVHATAGLKFGYVIF